MSVHACRFACGSICKNTWKSTSRNVVKRRSSAHDDIARHANRWTHAAEVRNTPHFPAACGFQGTFSICFFFLFFFSSYFTYLLFSVSSRRLNVVPREYAIEWSLVIPLLLTNVSALPWKMLKCKHCIFSLTRSISALPDFDRRWLNSQLMLLLLHGFLNFVVIGVKLWAILGP